MNRENLPRTVKELNAEDEKLCRMLGDLRKIDAPPTFDFAVKKRIAENRIAPPKLKLLTILRFAAPLALIIALAIYVLFNLSFTDNAADVPQVAEKLPAPLKNPADEKIIAAQSSPEISLNSSNAAVSPALSATVKTPKSTTADQNPTVKKPSGKAAKNDGEEFGGTRESASTGVEKIIVPRGLNPNQITPKPDVSVNNQPVPAAELLLNIGLETDSNYQVKSIKKNSLAEYSDIKTGDIIEAVDDTKITPETVFNKLLTFQTIHLVRNGKKIAVELGKR